MTSAETAREYNFDGLVGPTHNYAGLSPGNEASTHNAGQVSNPRSAALQGLLKMRTLHELGVGQGVLPPHERPHLPTLRAMGFGGTDADVLKNAWDFSPYVLARATSASSMWVANAATVTPSADSTDARVHFTPANLAAHFHRWIETPQTSRALRAIFRDPDHFVHHPALPGHDFLGDEGAANHMRLSSSAGAPGLELFVWGREALQNDTPTTYPARQTLEASRAVARSHRTRDALFLRQSSEAIDQGVFHNDVIAVSNENVLFTHASAFEDQDTALEEIRVNLDRLGATLIPIVAKSDDFEVKDAVTSYVFNSQLVTTGDGMTLVAPLESKENTRVARFLDRILEDDTPIASVNYMNLKESMKNGGGPACLRLRVVLTSAEREAVNPACLVDAEKLDLLESWVHDHYRDRLELNDLRDPKLLEESRTALDNLTQLLNLGSLYPFQRPG